MEARKSLLHAEILPEVKKTYFKNLEDFNAVPISKKVVANPKLLTIITRQKKVPFPRTPATPHIDEDPDATSFANTVMCA